ncbi:MAG: phage major capsid protein, partial [Ilumatobacteraceae bacterium]
MQNYLNQLRDSRQRAWHEAKELLEVAEREARELTGEEQAKWDSINRDIDEKDAQIRSFLDIEQREREADKARAAYEPVIVEAEQARRTEKQVDDMTRFLRGEIRSIDIDLGPAWREKRLIRSGAGARELRDLVSDTDALGGNTVPTSFQRQLVEYVEFYTGARNLNVTVLTTQSGEAIEIPNVATRSTAAIRGEGTALGEVDATFGQATLNAWKYGVLTQVSNELLTDTGIDMLGFIARDTAQAIARITDTDYVTGSGSSKPKGIISTQAVGATAQTASTGVPSYGNLVDLVYSVNPQARALGAYWFTLDTNAAKIRRITDTTGRPLWEPTLTAGEPDRLLGYPMVLDPNVAAFATAGGTHMAFGNFSSYYIRDVASVRFERSDDFAFSSDLVTFRTILRTDGDYVGGVDGHVKFLKA